MSPQPLVLRVWTAVSAVATRLYRMAHRTLWPPALTSAQQRPGLRSIPGLTVAHELQRGSYGVVYQAHDDQLGEVAVKHLYRRELPGALALKDLLRLNHANVVRHHRAISLATGRALVMELAVKDLFEHTSKLPSTADALAIMHDLSSGLAYLHGDGVVHLDVKQENLLVLGTGRVALADFDFARRRGQPLQAKVGTPAYWAPEMAEADRTKEMGALRADCAMDVWAAGIVCWELLTGEGRAMETEAERLWLRNFSDPLTERTGALAGIANAAARRSPQDRVLQVTALIEAEKQGEKKGDDEREAKRRRIETV